MRIISICVNAALAIMVLTGCGTRSGPTAATTKSEQAPVKPRITQFYASPASPPQGEKTLLCYGVENATEVRLNPPIERVWPTIARCFNVDSTKSTTYKLTAMRGGESVSESVTINPGPPAVKIIEVSINKLEFTPGEQATVCYKVKNSVITTLKPGAWVDVHGPSSGCIVDHPDKTTTYTVAATGAGGDTDSEHVTATVR